MLERSNGEPFHGYQLHIVLTNPDFASRPSVTYTCPWFTSPGSDAVHPGRTEYDLTAAGRKRVLAWF